MTSPRDAREGATFLRIACDRSPGNQKVVGSRSVACAASRGPPSAPIREEGRDYVERCPPRNSPRGRGQLGGSRGRLREGRMGPREHDKARCPAFVAAPLGALKAARAVGLLVGIGIRPIGIAASIGLVLYFVGASTPFCVPAGTRISPIRLCSSRWPWGHWRRGWFLPDATRGCRDPTGRPPAAGGGPGAPSVQRTRARCRDGRRLRASILLPCS
jgi:hypothetical protein